MSEADRLNDILAREAPAAARCLSPLARRSAFPRGIPFQTAEAKATEINATIGQVTDGRGNPLPVTAMAEAAPGVDPKMAWLYAGAEGHLPLRQAWNKRQRGLSRGSSAPLSLPMVVHGLTHAVSMVADTFADPDTDVVVADPCWENYHLVFQLRPGANVVQHPFFQGDRFDVDGFASAIQRIKKKGVITVSFPANPAGYTPTPSEAAQIAEAILACKGPAVVLFDDAYQGLVYEDGLMKRSLYWDVVERADPEKLFCVKADGATKELFFFGGRIAFLSTPLSGAADDALLSKMKCIARSMMGVCSGPSQALALKALQDPNLQRDLDERIAVLARRYRILKEALGQLKSPRLRPFPFNSGVFALIGVEGIDAEELRKKLIAEQSVGTIAIPSVNALRVAYCSVADEKIPELVRRIDVAVG